MVFQRRIEAPRILRLLRRGLNSRRPFETASISQQGGDSPWFAPALHASLTAVGIPAAMACAGYMIESAYRSFLGTSLDEKQFSGYVLATADFLFDLLATTSALFYQHPLSVTLTFAGFALTLILIRWASELPSYTARTELLVVFVLAMGCVIKVFYLDLPSVPLEGALLVDPRAMVIRPGWQFVEKRAKERWDLIVCSHVSSVAWKKCGSEPLSNAKDQLSGEFLINSGVTFALILMILAATGGQRGLGTQSLLRAVRWSLRTAAIFFAILDVGGMLYTYAKTVKPTVYQKAEIRFEKSPWETLPQPVPLSAFVLAQGDKQILIAPMSELTLWAVPVANVLQLKYTEQKQDILQFYMQKRLESPLMPPPARSD